MCEAYWKRVVVRPGECWGWTGSIHRSGYGLGYMNGKTRKAHRVSYELHYGPIPDGVCVLHSCDNPVCSNPEHLRLGSQLENIADRVTRNRGGNSHGEKNPFAKLTWDTVEAIRAEYSTGSVSQPQLARKYGVSQYAIWAVVNNKRWIRDAMKGEDK